MRLWMHDKLYAEKKIMFELHKFKEASNKPNSLPVGELEGERRVRKENHKINKSLL